MNLKYSQSISFWWDNPWNTSWESHFLKSLFYLREQSRSSCNGDQLIKYITEKQNVESESEKLYKSHKNVIQVKAIFSKLEPKSNQKPASVNKQNTRASLFPVNLSSTLNIFNFLCVLKKTSFQAAQPDTMATKTTNQYWRIQQVIAQRPRIKVPLLPSAKVHIVASVGIEAAAQWCQKLTWLHPFRINMLRLQNVTFSNKCGCCRKK